MFRRGLAALAAGAAVMMGTGGAGAATVVLSTTLDVAGVEIPRPDSLVFGPEDFSPFSVNVAEGDTLDWTIRFLPGQSLTLTDPLAIAPTLRPTYGDLDYLPVGSYLNQIDPARLQLLGPGDEVLNDFLIYPRGVSGAYLIGLFYSFLPGGPNFPSSLSFSGLRTVINVGDYVNIPQTTLTYQRAGLATLSADARTTVPEPASWGLLILGFLGLGAALRRRRLAGVSPSA
jgi:hypothetical protein